MKNKNDNNPSYESTFYLSKRILCEYILKYKSKLVISIIAMIISALTTSLNAYIIQPIIDKIFVEKNISFLLIISAALVLISIINAVFFFIQKYFMEYIVQNITVDLQLKLYKHLLYFDLKTLAKESSGKIISKLSNDVQILRRSINVIVSNLIKDFITLLFLIGLMFYQSIELSLIVVCLFPFSILPLIKLGKKMRKISSNIQNKMEDFIEHLDETFTNVRLIKCYNGEEFEIKRSSSLMNSLLKLNLKAIKSYSLAGPLIEMTAGFSLASIILYGGYQVINDYTTSGKFFSFITAMIMVYRPIKKLSKFNTSLQAGLAAATRIFKLLDKNSALKEGTKILKLNEKAHIVFKKVNFSYDKEPIIQNLNLDIPSGKTTALIGLSGSGKTTIMNMIPRLYNVDSGSISINGEDIKNVTLKSLRDQISIVSQEITIFDTTLEANIAYACQNKVTKEDIYLAAKTADADEFIKKLPKGYQTKLGQNGMNLSRGQRQRISIARAFLKNSPILLMDEATSALDNISEKKIQLSLEKLMANKTSIIIAHRLLTIINADIIHIIENGKIIESGTHKELLKSSATYNKLYINIKNN